MLLNPAEAPIVPTRMHLFTYGTLQFDEVWFRVTGVRLPTAPASLQGFRIQRVEGYEFPGICPSEDQSVSGTVYSGVTGTVLTRLDAFEGDFYERWEVEIDLAEPAGDGRLRCWAYVVPPSQADRLTADRWDCETFRASGGLKRFLGRYAGFRSGL